MLVVSLSFSVGMKVGYKEGKVDGTYAGIDLAMNYIKKEYICKKRDAQENQYTQHLDDSK